MQVDICIPHLTDPDGVSSVEAGRCPCVGDGHPLVMFWFKNVGDRVKAGEPVAEIAAGWTIRDITSPADGVVSSILVPGSQTSSEGAVIGTLETA